MANRKSRPFFVLEQQILCESAGHQAAGTLALFDCLMGWVRHDVREDAEIGEAREQTNLRGGGRCDGHGSLGDQIAAAMGRGSTAVISPRAVSTPFADRDKALTALRPSNDFSVPTISSSSPTGVGLR